MLQTFSEADLAWAAGFIDGEGSMGIYAAMKKNAGYKHPQHKLILTVYNTEPDPLHKLQAMFGGSITTRTRRGKKWRRGGVWVRQDQKAAQVIRLIRPYLVGKAKQADVALAFSASRHTHPGRRKGGIPEDVLKLRDEMQEHIAALKTVSYDADEFWTPRQRALSESVSEDSMNGMY